MAAVLKCAIHLLYPSFASKGNCLNEKFESPLRPIRVTFEHNNHLIACLVIKKST